MGLATSNLIKDAPANFLRFTKRKMRRFNVIPRAEKIVDNIPKTIRPPPKFDSTLKQIDRMKKEMPDSYEKLHKKNEQLLKNLENVYVHSEGSNEDKFAKSQVNTDIVRRFFEPTQLRVATEIPDEKYTSLRADQFLCAHAKDPRIFSPEVLSLIYKIDENVMRNILTHVKVLTVIKPIYKKKPVMRGFVESLVPPDFSLSDPLKTEKLLLIAAKTSIEKYYNKDVDVSKEMQEDSESMNKLSLLEGTEQIFNDLQRRRRRYRLVEKEEDEIDTLTHESYKKPEPEDVKPEAVKPEDVSFEKLIEDAIRRSDENERKLQEEEKKRKAEKASKKTVSSHSKVIGRNDEQLDKKIKDSISDEEIERLSNNIRSENVVKRDGFSSTGYYSVDDERSKKKKIN